MHKKRTLLTRSLFTVLFLLLTFCILTNSRLSLYYALTGLMLWFQKMVPVLLPFMILSGIVVRMGLTESFAALAYPLIKPLFHVSKNVCYVMIMGFLCGFPMGAKCVADLYSRDRISRREAEYLLAFCNNIGPVYFCGFVLPLLGCRKVAPYVIGMYGVPLLYGLLLRYTKYRDLDDTREKHNSPEQTGQIHLLRHLEDSIASSLQSIQMLGGYMILFNLLDLLPHLLLGRRPQLLAPLLEITGGLQMLGQGMPLYSLLALPFGGLSCIAQTYSCIRNTDLSICNYIFHKLILTAMTALWYTAWFLLRPSGFMG